MRVSNGGNPYIYQQKKATPNRQGDYTTPANGKSKDNFAVMYDKLVSKRPNGNQVKLEDSAVARDHNEDTIKFGRLETYQAETTQPVKCVAPPPKNPDSIYDLSLSELGEELYAASLAVTYMDKEGLSRSEIFKRIEEIYTEYLGKDFLEPRHVNMHTAGYIRELDYDNGKFDYYDAAGKYTKKLKEHGFEYSSGSSDFIELYGYTGMSNDEMRTAARVKYPDVMTLRDCINMAWEIGNLGLEPTHFDYAQTVQERVKMTIAVAIGGPSHTPVPYDHIEKVFNTLLDFPADYNTIVSSYDSFEKDDRTSYGDSIMADPIGSILHWFSNGSYDPVMLNNLRGQLYSI